MAARLATLALCLGLLGHATAAAEPPTQIHASSSGVAAAVSVRGPLVEALMANPKARALVARGLQRGAARLARLGGSGGGHAAQVTQGGTGSVAVVAQGGSGHIARAEQTALHSALGVVQIGRGQAAAVRQTASGELAIVVQAGMR